MKTLSEGLQGSKIGESVRSGSSNVLRSWELVIDLTGHIWSEKTAQSYRFSSYLF